eukprot:5683095-Ditylum_brightwellii.AAC.1
MERYGADSGNKQTTPTHNHRATNNGEKVFSESKTRLIAYGIITHTAHFLNCRISLLTLTALKPEQQQVQ